MLFLQYFGHPAMINLRKKIPICSVLLERLALHENGHRNYSSGRGIVTGIKV
jgi:hypothetical protein